MKVSIVLSVLGIAFAQFFSESVLAYLSLILIVSIGILHGANDILLIEKTKFISVKYKWLTKFIYTLIVLLAIGFFYFIPFFALLTFIIFSSYHFGEQHWSKHFKSPQFGWVKKVFQFTFGLFILSLLFLLKVEATNEVIYDLANFQLSKFDYTLLSGIAVVACVALGVFLARKAELTLSHFAIEFSLLILYAFVFNFTPLILGFAIYFAFWHSLPSLKDQIDFIYQEKLKFGIQSYFKDAGVYWLISVVGFGLFLYFFYESKLFYSLLFSFIAAITFPHVIVMGKMFSFLKNQKSE